MQTLRTAEWGVELSNFSPDGRYIVCSELVRQGAEERNIDILAVDGSRKTTIVSGSSNRHPFFTPDGRYVVFTSNRSGQWDLWMVPVAGGASAGAAVMADSSIGAVTLLGFATDGTLFYQQPVDRNQAWEVDIDPETRQAAGSPRPLSTRFAGNQIAPTWSPDGSRLVFATRRTAGAGTLEGPFSFTVSEAASNEPPRLLGRSSSNSPGHFAGFRIESPCSSPSGGRPAGGYSAGST
jgi:Tol biopolymer transport system component